MVNKTKKCNLCRRSERQMLWINRGTGRPQEVYAVCPTCDSSALGGPLDQKKKPEETEA